MAVFRKSPERAARVKHRGCPGHICKRSELGGRLDEAVACYSQVLMLKDLAPAHNNLGMRFAREAAGSLEVSYRHALALQPNLASAHNNLALCCLSATSWMRRARHRTALTRSWIMSRPSTISCGPSPPGEKRTRPKRGALAIRWTCGAHDNLGTACGDRASLRKPKPAPAPAGRAGFHQGVGQSWLDARGQGRLNEGGSLFTGGCWR